MVLTRNASTESVPSPSRGGPFAIGAAPSRGGPCGGACIVDSPALPSTSGAVAVRAAHAASKTRIALFEARLCAQNSPKTPRSDLARAGRDALRGEARRLRDWQGPAPP